MLQLLTYHEKVTNYFKAQSKTWDFFALAKTKAEQLTQYKTELLKNTYKFDPAVDVALYEKVALAKEKLGLQNLTVFVHQAQYNDELNASIIYLQQEAHIVFSGQLIQLLDEQELSAVIAHELTHIKLYTTKQGDVEIADRIITAISNNPNSEEVYCETARLFRLYTEIYCDRGAYSVLEDITPIVTSLVKVATGLPIVNADSYVRQANEIFAVENNAKANTLTHPENFIRARAIQLWDEKKELAEEEIAKMIEGLIDLDQLDIFKQHELSAMTKDILKLFLKPKWIQSSLVISQARQYFTDFSWADAVMLEADFRHKVTTAHASVKEYACYILLDFTMVDPALEDVPTGWAFQFAEDLGLKETFDDVMKRELKFSDKKLQQHKQKTLAAYYGVREGDGEQIYEG